MYYIVLEQPPKCTQWSLRSYNNGSPDLLNTVYLGILFTGKYRQCIQVKMVLNLFIDLVDNCPRLCFSYLFGTTYTSPFQENKEYFLSKTLDSGVSECSNVFASVTIFAKRLYIIFYSFADYCYDNR